MIMSGHHNAGYNRNLLIPNKSFKNVAKFKYFETSEQIKNFIYE
jgi:hypothetical protein